MSHFPGIALIVDDLFDKLTYIDNVTDPTDLIQQKSFKGIKSFCDNNGIPLSSITQTQDIEYLSTRIKSYNNVRLLILDLDLNNDGNVGEDDDYPFIYHILSEAVENFGYFFLLINSAHADKWEDIKKGLPEPLAFFSKKNMPIDVFDKNVGSIVDKLIGLQVNNYSLELIYDFECGLNIARDLAFKDLLDYDKRTWNRIYKQLLDETTSQSSFLLSSVFLSILKQYLLSINYSIPQNTDPVDESIAIKAFKNINYTDNKSGFLNKHPIWTGNLYYMPNAESKGLDYALIITPECDIAQIKFINFQVVLGFEVNNETFPVDYDPQAFQVETPPLYPLKAGKAKSKWRDRSNLLKVSNQIEHLYELPFVSEDNKTVVLDFRDLTFYPVENILNNWKLLARVNDPLITDILDKISLIFNRKGLLPILPTNIKHII